MTILVRQAPRPPFDDWFGDDLILTVRTSDGKTAADFPFHSSYTLFRLEVVDLTGDGTPELVLIEGIGRGTSVRSERLRVLAVAENRIRVVRIAPYSAFFGSGARWWYRHEYVDVDNDGCLEIRLRLHHTPIGQGMAERPDLIPKKEVVILEPS